MTRSVPPLLSKCQYLVIKSVLEGTPVLLAQEAVATTALGHPEWDLNEQKTWVEWEKS